MPLDSNGLGLGTNAVSCVRVAKNAHVKGFTLTGGHADYTTSDMPVGTDVSMTFSFAGEGSADVFGFSAQLGTLIFIK